MQRTVRSWAEMVSPSKTGAKVKQQTIRDTQMENQSTPNKKTALDRPNATAFGPISAQSNPVVSLFFFARVVDREEMERGHVNKKISALITMR